MDKEVRTSKYSFNQTQKDPDMKSALQKEAERQMLFMHNELSLTRQLMYSRLSKSTPTLDKSSYWHISHETMNGDFALDEVLAQELASRVVSNNPGADWLTAYLNNSPGPNAGFGEQLKDAAIGKSNMLGNVNASRQASEAVIAQSKINSATAKIVAGSAQRVKINSYMTLYNGDKSGIRVPRLRAEVTRLPIKVFSPLFSKEDMIRPISRGGFSARGKDVKDMTELAGLSSKTRFFNGKVAGGVLTFAPTIAFDLYDSFYRDANGNYQLDRRQFLNNEIQNQSGNVAGWVGGAAAGALAISFGAVGAPVIVCVLIGGIVVQALWNWSGAPNQMPQIESKGGY